MEWKGLAARFRSILHIRCAPTGTWNGRRVNCPGLLLGPACTPSFSVGEVVCAVCELPCQRVGVLRGGSREQMNAAEGLQYGWLSRRSADDFRAGTHSAAAPTAWGCSGNWIEARSALTNEAVR